MERYHSSAPHSKGTVDHPISWSLSFRSLFASSLSHQYSTFSKSASVLALSSIRRIARVRASRWSISPSASVMKFCSLNVGSSVYSRFSPISERVILFNQKSITRKENGLWGMDKIEIRLLCAEVREFNSSTNNYK